MIPPNKNENSSLTFCDRPLSQIPQPPEYFNTQPTIVFLHGGTWMAGGGGDGLFQPDYLIESDVTVVTINHRLGPFGECVSH